MTAQQAASQTRARIIRIINRKIKGASLDHYGHRFVLEIIAAIRTMDERQNKRRGGLGRK